MRHLLTDDEARDCLTGASWALRLSRHAERAQELLDADQSKLLEEMTSAQGAFAESLEVMAAVSCCEGLAGTQGSYQSLSLSLSLPSPHPTTPTPTPTHTNPPHRP